MSRSSLLLFLVLTPSPPSLPPSHIDTLLGKLLCVCVCAFVNVYNGRSIAIDISPKAHLFRDREGGSGRETSLHGSRSYADIDISEIHGGRVHR